MALPRALPASSGDIPVCTAAFTCVGHVLDRHQHIQFKIGRFDFVLLRLRIEAVVHIIVLLAARLSAACRGPT